MVTLAGAKPVVPAARQRIGSYQIIRKLAVGGMAEIYLAQLEAAHGFTKQVVIKRLLPHLCEDPAFIDMFLFEARLAAHLNHPNIAQVFDIGESEGRVYYVMEYVPGPDLRAVAKRIHARGYAPPLDFVVGVCIAIAAGLHYAHTASDETGRPLAIVHRDVTPSNVIVTYDGVAKLLDFGVAKASVEGRDSTAVGTLKGKLAYMSPEQIDCSRTLDGRSDVFSLGVMLWELTTLHRLYRFDSQIETIRKITLEDAPRPSAVRPDYPAKLERIVMRALARDRSLRYPDALSLQRDLEELALDLRLATSSARLAELMRELFPDERVDHRAEATDSALLTRHLAKLTGAGHRGLPVAEPSHDAPTSVESEDAPTSVAAPGAPAGLPPAPASAPFPVVVDGSRALASQRFGAFGIASALVGLALAGSLIWSITRDRGGHEIHEAQPTEPTPSVVEPEAVAPAPATAAEPKPEPEPTADAAPEPAPEPAAPPVKRTRASKPKSKPKPKPKPSKPPSDWNKNSLALPE